MAQKRKLDLKELELQLPAIDLKETKIILGGNDYGDDDFNPLGGSDMRLTGDFSIQGGHGNSNGGANDGGGYQDQGDMDHYYDDNNGEDTHTPDLDNGHQDDYNNQDAGPSGQNQQDGIDVEDFDKLIIDTGNSAFDDAITEIFASNSELADLIMELMGDGTNQITFAVADLGNDPTQPYKLAGTTHDPDPTNSHNNYTITFNSHSFDQNGNYVYDASGTATDGINFNDLSPQEELVATLAHELLHVKYEEMLMEVYEQAIANNEYLDSVANDLSYLYGDDFRDAYMFFDGTEWQWRDLSDPAHNALHNQYLHGYMNDHDHDFIQQVIDEYRNDFP